MQSVPRFALALKCTHHCQSRLCRLARVPLSNGPEHLAMPFASQGANIGTCMTLCRPSQVDEDRELVRSISIGRLA